jgi:hypothetical protein
MINRTVAVLNKTCMVITAMAAEKVNVPKMRKTTAITAG